MSLRSDKRDFSPHGLHGGALGTGPVSILVQNGKETELPVLVTKPYVIRKGDVFRHISPSCGGFGNPEDRPPMRFRPISRLV